MNYQDRRVDASPTKDFFIYMLTRDIDVKPAIVELIDNSIDGAKKIRPQKNYEDLFIKITIQKDKFIIEDNCGGIDIETAQKYAFKFGRAAEREQNLSAYFTGIFGIGMKRALFKLGRKFEVTSFTDDEYFQLTVNVDEWMHGTEWDFEFDDFGNNLKKAPSGTKIVVENLYEDISSKFDNEFFINSLIDYIQKYRTVEAENGLSIEVNNILIDYGKEKLLKSSEIQPYENFIDDKEGKITIIAGITNKGEPSKAGWYIYCNGRLVLYADKTELTGWGVETRAFHYSLAEFRGYVYFESQNLLSLPWNTTKTGVDTSNRLYLVAKPKMIEALNQISKEIRESKKKHDVSNLDSLDFIKKAKTMELTYSNISKIKNHIKFEINEKEPAIPMTTINFSKPTEEVEKVKDNMGVTTNRAVGIKLFEYYYDMEEL